MFNITCTECGAGFIVTEIINWQYKYLCDSCICKVQPKGYENPAHAREDEKIEQKKDFENDLTNTVTVV